MSDKNMKTRTRILSVPGIMLIISWFLYLVASYCYNATFINPISSTLMYVAVGVLATSFLVSIIRNPVLKFRSVLISMTLLAVSLFSAFATKDAIFVYLILFLFTARDFSFKDIVKIDLVLKVVVFLINLGAYFTGNVEIAEFTRLTQEVRIAFGFRHPNILGFFLLISFAEFMYVLEKRWFLKSMLALVFCVYCMLMADSRTSLLCVILTAIVMGVYKIFIRNSEKSSNQNNNKKNKFILTRLLKYENACGVIFGIGLLVMTALSFWSTQMFVAGGEVDSYLSGRIALQQYYDYNFDISLLGMPMDFANEPLDNAYYRVIYNYGIVGLIFVAVMFGFMMKSAMKRKDYIFLILIPILMVYGVSEWYIVRPVLNIFLISSAELLSPIARKDGKDE